MIRIGSQIYRYPSTAVPKGSAALEPTAKVLRDFLPPQ